MLRTLLVCILVPMARMHSVGSLPIALRVRGGDGDRESITRTLQGLAEHAKALAKKWEEDGKLPEDVEQLRRATAEAQSALQGGVSMDVAAGLADALVANGKFEEAEVMQKELLAAMREEVGELHPGTLTAMHNLAGILYKQGKLEEAEEMFEEEVTATREVLGDKHPDALAALGDLAETLRAQGRLPEAEAMQREVLDARRELMGGRHPDTLTAINCIACILGDATCHTPCCASTELITRLC